MTGRLYHIIKGQRLKCFEDWQGFDEIKPINVIVGRNNSGKSALLDLVTEASTGPTAELAFHRRGRPHQISLEYLVTEDDLKEAIGMFHELRSVGINSHAEAKRVLAELRLTLCRQNGISEERAMLRRDEIARDDLTKRFAEHLFKTLHNPLHGKTAIRLRADRDIWAEPFFDHMEANQINVDEDGKYATSLIVQYLFRGRQHHQVEKLLLADLNRMLEPDWHFERIFPKQIDKSHWELALEDAEENLTLLSHMGSGVKTILLVLVKLLLVPHAKTRRLSDFFLCFEELENNLHPAVQRRLFRYLREKAVNEKTFVFITTHSNIVIDLFAQDDQAQILHVVHDGKKAEVRTVSTDLHRGGLLDDLDVRASDLLQANVLVWVEGPSDRFYFNRWVELWTDGKLQEQVHYQCVWYGGALLANVSFEGNVPDEALVNALRVNRHAIVLMDSDRREASTPLKPRVERVRKELEGQEGIAWVTAGREVENYIPLEALRAAFERSDLSPPGPFEDVFAHLGSNRDKKMDLAHNVIEHFTKEQLQRTHDLAAKLDQVCKQIRAWNGQTEP
jgi:putative ATP-dependent endonuclease of OLD family